MSEEQQEQPITNPPLWGDPPTDKSVSDSGLFSESAVLTVIGYRPVGPKTVPGQSRVTLRGNRT